MSNCDQCNARDVPDQQKRDECACNGYRDQSGVTWEGCRAASPEAQAKQASRSGQTNPIWSEPNCFSRIAKHRESMQDILKWWYPQVCGHGTYRQDLMVKEQHRHEVRVFRLRGAPKPRDRDEVERSMGIREDQQVGGIYGLAYANHPAFALIKKA